MGGESGISELDRVPLWFTGAFTNVSGPFLAGPHSCGKGRPTAAIGSRGPTALLLAESINYFSRHGEVGWAIGETEEIKGVPSLTPRYLCLVMPSRVLSPSLVKPG